MNVKALTGMVAVAALGIANVASASVPIRAEQARTVGKKLAKPSREMAQLENANALTSTGYVIAGLAIVAVVAGVVILATDDDSTN